jgi:hypothetical protein
MANPWEEYQMPKSGPWSEYQKPVTVNAETYDPTEGNSLGKNLLIGIGKGMTDIVQGGKQVLGMTSNEDIAQKRNIDKAIMNTAGGKVGNILGQTALIAPAAFVPGANTYLGASLIGAGAGALQPVIEDESRLNNMVMGGAGGVVGQKLGNVVGQKIGQQVAKNTLRKSQRATADATLKQVQESGFAVPRSLYDPSFTSNRLESLGGKAATLQQASAKNQEVVNSFARKALNLSDDTPLSMKTVETVRKSAYKPYEDIADISQGAKNTLKELKQARADAKGWFNAYNRSARPDDLAKAQEFSQIADLAEQVIDDYAKQAGKPELLPALAEARKTIAKTYTIERAMNKATGDINPRVLGRLYEKGSPLSDGLDDVGRFAAAFPKAAQPTNQSAGSGISALEPMAAGIYGAVGQAATGNPAGLFAAGIPLLRGPARSLSLYNMMKSTPSYGGLLLNMSNRAAPSLPYLGTIGGGLLGANSQ